MKTYASGQEPKVGDSVKVVNLTDLSFPDHLKKCKDKVLKVKRVADGFIYVDDTWFGYYPWRFEKVVDVSEIDGARVFHTSPLTVDTLLAAIRKHRDQRGDDRCWMDDEELYKVLPEGYTPPERDTMVMLKNCERFIACRHHPETKYVSPEREIEQLKARIKELETKC